MSAVLLFSLLFFFLGYLLGRLGSSSLVWRISLIGGIASALIVFFLTNLSYFDVSNPKLSFNDYFGSLAGGFIIFVSILAGGKMGNDFRGSKKR